MWISPGIWRKVSLLSNWRKTNMFDSYGRKGMAVLILLCIGSLYAQDMQAVDSLFYRGVAAYQNQQFRDSDQIFELLDEIYPNHHRSTATLLMRGKCSYKLEGYQRALKLFSSLCDNYPQSRYCDNAIYSMGNVYYRLNRFNNAVTKYLEVVEAGRDTRLMIKAAKHASDIMDFRLDQEQLKSLYETVKGEKSEAAVTLRLVRRELESKRFQTVRRRLQHYLEMHPESTYRPQFEKLLSQAENLGSRSLKIGVILPLSGSFEEQGRGLLQGIQYAVDQHNQNTGTKVDLVIRDSRSRVLTAIQAVQELCDNEEIVAIIGELESTITATISGIAQERKVSLLAPTATEDGITSIGSYIFQVNTSLNLRGKMLAEYAVSGLGLKRFAILAPADHYGMAIRDGFVETVENLEGEILTEIIYYEGSTDREQYLSTQLKAIRKAGIEQMVQDSLIVILPKEALEEMEELPQDTLYVSQQIPELTDSMALAVTSLDGILLPVHSEDLPIIMPQLAYYNLKSKFFGGAYWYDEEILDQNKSYIDGVVFLSDTYVNPANYQYHNFRNEFRSAMGTTPEKMQIYGYDTVRLLLQITGEKNMSRDEIRDRLAQMKQFEGIRGKLGFNEDRINPFLRLLQYRVGKIYQIK